MVHHSLQPPMVALLPRRKLQLLQMQETSLGSRWDGPVKLHSNGGVFNPVKNDGFLMVSQRVTRTHQTAQENVSYHSPVSRGQFFGKQSLLTIISTLDNVGAEQGHGWLFVEDSQLGWPLGVFEFAERWFVPPLFPTFQRSKIWIISQKIQGKMKHVDELTYHRILGPRTSYLEHLENFSELFQLKYWNSFGSVQNGSKVKNLD